MLKENIVSREFLFRGIRVDSGDWVYGHYIKGSKCFCNAFGFVETDINGEYIIVDCDYIYCIDCDEGDFISGLIEVIPETIGQYTGLDDVDGIKIFEYDILKYRKKDEFGEVDIVGVVLWNRGNYDDSENNGFYLFPFYSAWYLKETGDDYCNLDSYGKIYCIEDFRCKIIGNIFDNKELITTDVFRR
jgi:uncharacterized phage protein (TIGR01671 family)